jgi:predicted metal-binding protein
MRHNRNLPDVEVTNLKRILPACRRCRIRSDEMLRDDYQPMICNRCRDVISESYPHMVPIDKVDFEKARNCLWNHERECACWEEGLRFPEKQ